MFTIRSSSSFNVCLQCYPLSVLGVHTRFYLFVLMLDEIIGLHKEVCARVFHYNCYLEDEEQNINSL